MAYDVKFLKGTAAQYSAATKDNLTFYYTTDDNKVYLGTIELSNSAIADLVGDLTTLNTTNKNTVVAAINEVLANEGALSGLSTDAKNTLVAAINEIDSHADANTTAIGTIANLKTSEKTNLVGAINEVKDAVDDLTTDSAVSLKEATTPTSGYLKTYELYQGGETADDLIGKIDIPKDLVVTSGEIVNNPEGQPAGKYLKLTIANQETPVYINVKDLVDVYTAQASAAQIQLAISDTNVISATIVADSITTTELADDAVETDNIKDKAVTKAKLAQTVQDSLNAADSALQKADITTGSANGTISVDGDDVAVKGLGSAAYTDSTAYDASGLAATAEANAKSYTEGLLTWQTIS